MKKTAIFVKQNVEEKTSDLSNVEVRIMESSDVKLVFETKSDCTKYFMK